MLEGNPQPLAIASRVLAPDTLSALRRHPYHLAAWHIADRWAFNQPEQLRALEAEGEIMVLIRLPSAPIASRSFPLNSGLRPETRISRAKNTEK